MGSIELVKDYEAALSLVNDPYCVARAAQDGCIFEATLEDVKKMAEIGYLLGHYERGELKGLCWLEQFNYSSLRCHINYAKKDRAHAVGKLRKVLKWLDENADPRFKRVLAMIPSHLSDTIRFSKREGMSQTGVIQSCFMYNGIERDLIVLSVNIGGENANT